MDKEISSSIVAAIYLKHIEKIKSIFANNPDILVDMPQNNGNDDTCLHIACQNNSIEMLEQLLRIFRETYINLTQQSKSDKIKNWVNSQNDEGLTPLHIACYQGNLYIINLQDTLGADPSIKAINGESIYHLAVKFDQIISLFYFFILFFINPFCSDKLYIPTISKILDK